VHIPWEREQAEQFSLWLATEKVVRGSGRTDNSLHPPLLSSHNPVAPLFIGQMNNWNWQAMNKKWRRFAVKRQYPGSPKTRGSYNYKAEGTELDNTRNLG
jgi:hypothetical protein